MDTQDSLERDDLSNEAITSKLNDALLSGQRSLRTKRRSVGVGCLSLGVGSYILYFLNDPVPHPLSQYETIKFSTFIICPLLYNFRFLAIGFAPLADDLRLTRLVVCLDAGFLIVDEVLWFDTRIFSWYFLSVAIITSFFFMRVFCRPAASVMQKELWSILAVNRFLDAVGQMIACMWLATMRNYAALAYQSSWGVVDFVLFLLIVHPYSLQRMSGWFHWIFEAQRGSKAASGIAGLIGGCSVSEALAQAKPRFRCVRMDQLNLDDFFDSPAAPGVTVDRRLFERTQTCNLGSCDAFLSHSWHDDAQQKWHALQQWRAEFVAQHGREPRIWFDKACIDQQSIQEDLRGLPIFLGGSKELVILCGPTYLSRLWCIVELFTFVHIGYDAHRITVLPVIRKVEAHNDAAAIRRAFQDFDAERCLCFSQEDKRRMLEIIMAAFGGMAQFNCAVRKLLGFAVSELSVSLDHAQEPNTSGNNDSVQDTDSHCESSSLTSDGD